MSEHLKRKGDQTMKLLIAFGFSLLILAATLVIAQQSTHSESFTDRNGSFAGSAITRGNSTSFSDRNGRFDGTAIHNSNGMTSFYDKNGHFIGSRSNTTQPR